MTCASCGAENREGRKFCVQCGAKLALKCPKCGNPYESGESFCGECGNALASPAATASASKFSDAQVRVAAAASENLEGERKTVTALFADIKGSTELEQDLDPEEARAIIDPALKLMIDAVRRYDGYIVQSTGDGIFALFGAPVAHEDHPQRALYAGLRDAGRAESLLGEIARGWQSADRGARRREHRRGGRAIDLNWRRTYRVHAYRAHHQPGLADAGACADRLDRRQRADAQAGRGLLRAQASGSDQGQRRHRTGQRLRSDRASDRCARVCSAQRGAD